MSELKDGKHIKLKEYILYVLAVFFYTKHDGYDKRIPPRVSR